MIDRILASLRALVESFTERQPMSFVWRYSVVEVTETAFSGRALSALCPFADMPNIPLMPGIAGAGVKPAVGSIAGVAFLDGDPSKPFVVCWDQTVPVSVSIDTTERLQLGPSSPLVEIAGGGQAIHRVNDFGQGGTLTGAGALTYSGPNGGTGTITASVVITSFSPTPVPIVFAGSASLTTQATTGSTKGTCGG